MVSAYSTGFAESDLKAFFDVIPDILEPEAGLFSFWNGLGATSKLPNYLN